MELPEEHRMLADLVAKFVDRDLMPLEPAVLAREARGEKYGLTRDEEGPLLARCREARSVGARRARGTGRRRSSHDCVDGD